MTDKSTLTRYVMYSSETHAIEQERDALRISSAKLDKDVGELIDERDRAEDAISQAYFLITGRPAEWSNLWGYDEALEEIDAAQTLLRKERDALKAALRELADVFGLSVEAYQKRAPELLDKARALLGEK